MKRLLTSAVALTLLIASPALAEKDHDRGGKHDQSAKPAKPAKDDRGGPRVDRGDRGDRGGPRGDRGDRGGPRGDRGDRGDRGGPRGDRGDRGDRGGPRGDRGDRGDRGGPRGDRGDRGDRGGPRGDRGDRAGPRGDRAGPRGDRDRGDRRGDNWDRNDRRGPNWNRGDRPRNFDRRSWQRNGWASRKFRGGYYRKPAGWYYRRWGYGQILPFAFFARDYWLTDYYAYDLPAPPYGYEWIRYGDDAILVDIRTGMILQVQYGVFY